MNQTDKKGDKRSKVRQHSLASGGGDRPTVEGRKIKKGGGRTLHAYVHICRSVCIRHLNRKKEIVDINRRTRISNRRRVVVRLDC